MVCYPSSFLLHLKDLTDSTDSINFPSVSKIHRTPRNMEEK